MYIKMRSHSKEIFGEAFVNANEGCTFAYLNTLYTFRIKVQARNGNVITDAINVMRLLTNGSYSNVGRDFNIRTFSWSLIPELFNDKNIFEIGEKVYRVGTLINRYDAAEPYDVEVDRGRIWVNDDLVTVVGKNLDGSYIIDAGYTKAIRIQGELLCREMEIIPFVV